MKIRLIIFLALLSFINISNAEVYKCQGLDGKLKYTDRPCNKDAEKQTVAKIVVPPPSVAITNKPSLKAQDEAFKERHRMRNDYDRCLADRFSQMCFSYDRYAVRRYKD
jgi:hypothetical protein